MSDDSPMPSARRNFLTRTAALAALGAFPGHVGAAAEATVLPPEVDTRKAWLEGITTECRQFFDTAKMDDAAPLIHVVNYFGAWRATPGIAATDVTAVLGVAGMAVPALFGDAVWQKYELGKAMKLVEEATGQPYVRNPYMAPRNGELRASAASAPAALQKLGARIILCNNALGAWVGRTAAATKLPMPEVRAEWLAALAPGVMLVPSLMQAVEQAQRAGLTYIKNS